jgi:hypothetical protein
MTLQCKGPQFPSSPLHRHPYRPLQALQPPLVGLHSHSSPCTGIPTDPYRPLPAVHPLTHGLVDTKCRLLPEGSRPLHVTLFPSGPHDSRTELLPLFGRQNVEQ